MSEIRKKVIALIRVSTKEQANDDRAGIPRQQEAIKRICKSRNLECIDTLTIDDVSGTETHRCPEIQHLLSRLRTENLSGIIVADFDRLMRPDEFGHLALLDSFAETNAILHIDMMPLDLSTQVGRQMAMMLASQSSGYIYSLKKNVHDGKESKRIQGRCPNSSITLPTGVSYDHAKEKMGLPPEQCWSYTDKVLPIVEAFRLVDEEQITNYRELERRTGIQNRTLHNILRNEIYVGYRVYKEKRSSTKSPSKNGRQADRKKVKRAVDEIIRVKVMKEPAVDSKRFKRVQNILTTKKTGWKDQRKSPATNLITGVGRCNECGSILYCTSGKRKDRTKRNGYYMCKKNHYLNKKKTGGCPMKNIPQQTLDDVAVKYVSEELSRTAVIKNILNHYMETNKSSYAEHEQIAVKMEKKISNIKRRQKKMKDDYVKEIISGEEYAEFKKMLESELITTDSMNKKRSTPPALSNIKSRLALLAKGAVAFSRIADNSMRKIAIHQLFEELHVKDAAIVGFTLKPQFHADVCQMGTRTYRDSLRQPA